MLSIDADALGPGLNLSGMYLKKLYESNSFVYPAVNRIAQKIAAQPLEVHRVLVKNGKTTSEAVDHASLAVIRKPNPLQTYYHFMSHVISELVLMGNASVLSYKKDLLIPIPWESVTPSYTKDGMQYVISGHSLGFNGQGAFGSKNIIHPRLVGIANIYEGMSPFQPGKSDLEYLKNSKDFLNSSFVDGASPDIVFTTDKDGPDYKEMEKFLSQIYSSVFGGTNKRRPMATPKGIKAQRMPQNLADPEQKYHDKETKLNLLALLNIPPHELGIQDAGSLGSEEARIATRNFWNSTLIPIQKIIEESFGDYFFGGSDKYCLKFNNDSVDCLKDDEIKKADIANKSRDFMTVDEIRERYYSLPPLPSGAGASLSRIPIVKDDQTTLANKESPEIPPNPAKEKSGVRQSAPKRDWLKARLSLERQLVSAGTEKLLPRIDDWLRQQVFTICSAVEKISRRKSVFDDLDALMADIEGAVDDALEEAFEASIHADEAFWKVSEAAYDIFLTGPLIPNDPAIAKLKARNKKGRRKVLEARKLESFAGISETTTEQILDDVQKAMKGSETIQEIARRIERFQLEEIIPKRAETIARTEVLGAVSYAQAAASDDIEKAFPDESWEYVWLSSPDNRTRGSHAKLDMKRIPKGDKFPNDLRYPRDPHGKASETINCRCSWLQVKKGEKI